MANTKSRKYQLTFNNPLEHNYSHDVINEKIKNISWDYYCLCDEVGENGTPHTHLFFCCKNAVSFEKVKKLFSIAHIEQAKGSCQENRDYIRKEGKYINSDKKETNKIETFEEYGVMPLDKSAKNQTVAEQVLEMIKQGFSNTEIIEKFPCYSTKISHIEATRQTLLMDEYKNKWRNVEVYYIFGETGTGKTRFVMEKFGYENVCKVSNYKNPFDNYNGQDILLLDEFRSQITLSDMLQYLDGYPCNLPARYSDRVACYSKVYIISNIDLNKQYPNVQETEKSSWNAFIRRFKKVLLFEKGNYPFSNEETSIIELLPSEYFIEE